MNSDLSDYQMIGSQATDALIIELKENLKNLFNSPDDLLLEELSQKFKWKELTTGQQLFKQGDTGESLCIVISGRLKAVINEGTSKEKVVGEISKGESVGEMALMTGEARTASVYALRDSVLVELNKEHFEELISEHPSLLMSFSRIIISRLTYTMNHTKVPAKNYTIALVPATPEVPIRELAQELTQAMATTKKVLHVNYDNLPIAYQHKENFNRDDSFQLTHWLTTQEIHYDYILYETDPINPAWTQKCLRQADKIVVVVNAGKEPALSALEAELFVKDTKIYKQAKEVIILYPADAEFPAVSHQIVALRPVNSHYNIRWGDQNHINRLARMLTNTGIGLVLSGGGARGFAHIGIFKALKEKNIPVDMVCGTSIGAIIAAGIALDYKLDFLLKQYRQAFVDEKPLSDYTLPVIAFLKGHKLQKVLHKYFRDFHIEDLWLNFFCVSSNYTTSEINVHHKGPVWKAVTASVSIPGVLPPVVEGNNLLVDGGVVNNFPVDIMKAKYGGKLIGIDLKIEKEYQLDYTHLPGGWYLLLAKFLPFLKRYRVPGIATIMMKSTLLASTQHQRLMADDLDLYLRPPVSNFGLLNLHDFDKIVQTGYTYAQETLDAKVLKDFSGIEQPVNS